METGIRLTPGCLPLRSQMDRLSLIKAEHPGRGMDLHTITNSALYVLSLIFPRQNQAEPPCRLLVGDDGDEAFKERGSGKTVWLNVKPQCTNIFSRSQGRRAREEDWREASKKAKGEPESFRGTQCQVSQTRTEIVFQLGD